MKFLANENFPATSYKILKSQNLDIEHIGESNMGISEEEVMKTSIKEQRIIITFDSDYGELVFKYGYKPVGVIFLRIKEFSPDFPAQLLGKLVIEEKLEVEGRFTVIDENQIRQRKI